VEVVGWQPDRKRWDVKVWDRPIFAMDRTGRTGMALSFFCEGTDLSLLVSSEVRHG